MRDKHVKLVLPNLGMAHVVGMKCKVSAGTGIRAIVAKQATGFLSADAWNLRFVRVQGGNHFGRSIRTGSAIVTIDEAPHCRGRLAAADLVGAKTDAFGKVQPHIAVRAAFNLFLGQIAQHGTSQSPIRKARVQSAQKGRKRGDVMKVLHCIHTQVVVSELACAPSSVEGMSKELMSGDARIQRALKHLNIHIISTSEK